MLVFSSNQVDELKRHLDRATPGDRNPGLAVLRRGSLEAFTRYLPYVSDLPPAHQRTVLTLT